MSVTVQYRAQRDYCGCCNQKLPEPTTSKVQTFTISKKDMEEWSDDWDEIAECQDDMVNVVSEFVHDLIDFVALSSYEKLLIEDSEIERVRNFIMKEVVSAAAEA